MSEGEWILGRVRAVLPPRLRTLWQFGLTIMFVVGALLFVALDQSHTSDYVRVFGFAQAAYIVLIAWQIGRVNLQVRQQLQREAGDLTVAKMLPTHILLLAAGTIFSTALICAVMIEFYGDEAVLGGLFPYLANGVFFTKVLGLNLIWRFVLSRREEQR